MTINKVDSNVPNVHFISVDGLLAAQNYYTLDLLEELKKLNIQQVIEIGTNRGGLSLLLAKIAETYTFDIEEWEPKELRQKLFSQVNNLTFIKQDCFNSSYLKRLLSNDKKTLLVCDGGNKINEFNYFAPYLNQGDLISCHDYFPNKVDYNYWVTCEIKYSDIKLTCQSEKLIPILKELSYKAAWGLFEKQSLTKKIPHPYNKGLYKRLS